MTTPLSLASVQVRFPTPINNNAVITGYTYMLCQDSCANTPSPLTTTNSMEDGGYTTINIGDLVPNSVYILRVAAINEAGIGPTPTMDGDAHIFNSSTSGECVTVCVHACLSVCRDWRNCVCTRHTLFGTVKYWLQRLVSDQLLPCVADAAPINLAVSTSLTTDTTLLVTWALPSLATLPDVTTTSFNVTWIRETAGSGLSETVSFVAGESPGYLISGLVADGSYDIAVVAMYSTPMLVSDAATVRGDTLRLGEGELTTLSLTLYSS